MNPFCRKKNPQRSMTSADSYRIHAVGIALFIRMNHMGPSIWFLSNMIDDVQNIQQVTSAPYHSRPHLGSTLDITLVNGSISLHQRFLPFKNKKGLGYGREHKPSINIILQPLYNKSACSSPTFPPVKLSVSDRITIKKTSFCIGTCRLQHHRDTVRITGSHQGTAEKPQRGKDGCQLD